MWGDPHIVTLDGVKYTYNTLGCVHLIHSPGIKMQAKTDYAVTMSGRKVTKATVFVALAIHAPQFGSVSVNLNKMKTGWFTHAQAL